MVGALGSRPALSGREMGSIVQYPGDGFIEAPRESTCTMKVGIAGFAGSGKSTVFRWLTGVKPDPAASLRGQVGMARIPDERLDWLSSQFRPKKTTPATIEFLDTPGLIPTERRDNPRRLGILREGGGLLVVLNGYGE